MKFEIGNDAIIIRNTKEFNTEHILDCGQVFRYRKSGDSYTLSAKNHKCLLHNENNCVIIKTEDTEFFVDYFDLNRDYGKIKDELLQYKYLDRAMDYGGGIRILNQDPYEMIISFIISANNNIPRIKQIIEKLCRYFGKEKDGFYAFPSADALANADVHVFREIGAGYRAEYLSETSKILANEFDLNELYTLSTVNARKKLLKLKGVGRKVADCILLFAYHKTDLFPMDTWSQKIYNSYDLPPSNNINVMSDRLVGLFGNLSGYAQQYLYYYIRNNKT